MKLFITLIVLCMWQQDERQQREQMVREQLEHRGIHNQKVLDALREVPRHAFVPDMFRHRAYEDGPLPIGYGQTISQPYIVAYMTEKLQLKKSDRVLEIGTGSGYQAAVLSRLVDTVFTIEIVEPLGIRAREQLQELGYDNVQVRVGDGYAGWPEHAPYDAIVVTAAPEIIPPPLIDQLGENGRMIIPLGAQNAVQQLLLLEKKNGKLTRKHLIAVRFVPFVREK